MKSQLVRDKAFLKSLYEGENTLKNKDFINFATESELNTLIKYLHFVASGQISINKVNFETIQKSRKLKIIQKNVDKKAQASNMLKNSRAEKVKFLWKLIHIYPALLSSLFNQS